MFMSGIYWHEVLTRFHLIVPHLIIFPHRGNCVWILDNASPSELASISKRKEERNVTERLINLIVEIRLNWHVMKIIIGYSYERLIPREIPLTILWKLTYWRRIFFPFLCLEKKFVSILISVSYVVTIRLLKLSRTHEWIWNLWFMMSIRESSYILLTISHC